MIGDAGAALVYLARRAARRAAALRPPEPPGWVSFTLDGAIADYARPEPLVVRLLRPPAPSLLELRDAFRAVAATPGVRGVVLHLRPLDALPAQLDTLRGLVEELRGAGKRVVAWSYTYSLATYYVASAADEILLLPGGSVGPLGIASPHVFLADALRRIGVSAEVERVSPYKTAGDLFARSAMSPEDREMSSWLLDDRFEQVTEAIARGRRTDAAAVRRLVDATPAAGEQAVRIGLVDGLATQESLPARLGDADGAAEIVPWAEARRRLSPLPLAPPGRHVALLPVEGAIVDGRSGRGRLPVPARLPIVGEGRAGDLTIAQVARSLARDARVGAVVVYVQSSGGSSTASEAMHAAIADLAARKPLIVAMGGVAASGGYYVALPGREIFAQPGTITGSIGVIFAKGVISGLLDRAGIGRETLHRGERALIWSADREMTERDREHTAAWVREIYALFLERVAAGRGMSAEAVEAVAGGRVWTGRQALARGLVDREGALHDAIARAKAIAGLSPHAAVRVATPGRRILPPPGPVESLGEALSTVAALERAPLLLSPVLPAPGLEVRL